MGGMTGAVPPQFLQQEERRQQAEVRRQQEQQAQELQQLQQQQAENLVELEQMQVPGSSLPAPPHLSPSTSPRVNPFPLPPRLSQREKMQLLEEQERRQLGRLDEEHAMELSEWKQRLAARKEVSGSPAPVASRARSSHPRGSNGGLLPCHPGLGR